MAGEVLVRFQTHSFERFPHHGEDGELDGVEIARERVVELQLVVVEPARLVGIALELRDQAVRARDLSQR